MATAALPSWPAMMRRALAARYCDLSAAEFEREVNEGRLPMPIMLGKSEHWSRRKLDEALEALHGGVIDWRSELGLNDAA
jgi:predicted DNA-binding transcriptional regulator AlpA